MERDEFEKNSDSDNSADYNYPISNTSQNASQFKYKDSLFLYLIYEGFKCGVLTLEEKIKLKELIWIQHPIVYELLKKYDSTGQVMHFWKLVKKCILNQEYDSGNTKLNNSSESKLNNLSSPGDCALIRQKKIKLIKSRNKIQKEICNEDSEKSNKESDCSNLSTENVSQNSEIFIKTCKKGGSPFIEVKKKAEDRADFFREEEKE